MVKFFKKKLILILEKLSLQKFFKDEIAKPIFNNYQIKNIYTFQNFINLKSRKKFFIIRRSPGAGMFSNVTFILNKIKFAEKHNLIPIIDMHNFTTIYNEKTKILSTNNAWEYYFEKLNKYSLHFAYKSKKYYISENKLSGDFSLDILSKKINKYFKLIKFKSYLLKKSKAFIKKNFKKNDKILGVHFRGTTYKVAQKHAFPATSKIMIKHVKKLIRNYDYNKIFISTEEQKYLDIFKKEFKDMCLFTNSFRSTNIDAFKTYPRKNHRYKLGEEIILDTLVLSKCEGFTFIKSNVSSAAISLKKTSMQIHEINLGYNSSNKFIARWLWYLKIILPKYMFGLKIINEKNKII